MLDKMNILSVFSSITGLISALLIFIAGNHNYGVFSTVWQHLGIGGLLMISFVSFGISIACITGVKRKNERILLPAAVLIPSIIPFIGIFAILVVRFILRAD